MQAGNAITRRCGAAWLIGLAVLLSSCARVWAAPRLELLVTNDDGFAAPGIVAMAAALADAGHAVTVVAPRDQQSGSGVKITLGTLELVEQAPRWWSVGGAPADAVSVALGHVLRESPPALVISGANLGQNLGNNVFISGTVGAGVMALLNGVPAIAVSVGLDLAEARAQPERFPSTVAAFPRAAAFTARLVERLSKRIATGRPLLPPGVLLNVNYPAVADVKGVRVAPVGRHGGFRLVHPPDGAGERAVVSTIVDDAAGAEDDGSDTAWFAAGYVTLSLVAPDWNAGTQAPRELRQWLTELAASLEP